jgi:hypothetical protein
MRTNKQILEELSKKEHHIGKGFISDGIIDESRWNNSKIKIMFLLKEAYGDQKEDWDITKLIRDEWKGPKHKIWWTASYWLYAIHKTSSEMIQDLPSSVPDFDLCKEYLLSTSIVNIKKSFGTSSSNDEDLWRYVEWDKELL